MSDSNFIEVDTSLVFKDKKHMPDDEEEPFFYEEDSFDPMVKEHYNQNRLIMVQGRLISEKDRKKKKRIR